MRERNPLAAWKASVPETAVVKAIRDGLTASGIPHYEIKARTPCPRCHQWPAQACEPGIPDLIGWIPRSLLAGIAGTSVPLFIEVKRPQGGIESQAQKQFVERAVTDGGIALFARSWECVSNVLKACGVRIPKGL